MKTKWLFKAISVLLVPMLTLAALPASQVSAADNVHDDVELRLDANSLKRQAVPEIDIQGNGISILDGDNTPVVADGTEFGGVYVVGQFVEHTFTIYNTGTTPLNLSNFTLTGASNGFTFNPAPVPTAVPPGGSYNFVIRFDPNVNGGDSKTFTFSVTTDDADENPYTFDVHGTRLMEDANVQGNGVTIFDGDVAPITTDGTDWGNVGQGVPVDRTFTIQNTGSANLTITGITFVGGVAADFGVVANPTSPVPPGGSTTFTIRLTAGAGGGALRNTTVNIATTAINENPYDFAIQGTRIAAAPEIEVLGNALTIDDGDATPNLADGTNFGDVPLGGNSVVTYTIRNNGTDNLTIGAPTFTGDFSLATAPISPVAAGGSTTVQVRFTPAAAGVRNGTISFVNNDVGETPYNFALTGNGLPNSAPTTTGIANVNVAEDAANTSIDLWTSFVDLQDTDAQLTYTVTGNTNAGLFTSVTAPAPGGQFLVLDYAANQNGASNITVRATDTGGLFVETTFTVTIAPANDTPSFTSVPVTAATQGALYTYNIVTDDPDAPDTLTITAPTLPTWLTFTDNGNRTATLAGTPTNADIGPHTVVLRVTDGVIAVPVEQSFIVTVTDVNDAPTFTSAPVTTAGESTLYTYNIVTNDPDTGNTLTITAPTLPVWLTFTDNGDRTATLSGTPNSSQVGVFPVSLAVSDGSLTGTQNFNITVGNTAPQVANNGINTLANTGDSILTEGEVVTVNVTRLFVTFNQNVYNPAGDVPPHDVTYAGNYLLVRDNGDGFQTTGCDTGVDVLDTAIAVNSATYSGAGPFVTTVNINGGLPLSNGNYRLFVCGTTSIVDVADPTLELAGDGTNPGTDFVRNFSVAVVNNGNTNRGGNDSTFETSSFTIPATGFAPGKVTALPHQPAGKAYKSLDELRIEVPTLGINFPIVGAMVSDNSWDLTWLQNSVAYLEGSAYPTLVGNTVLSAHVTDASNNIGPFSDIKGMKTGQLIYIHFNGQKYVYQVQENRKISPSNISTVFKHENYSWVTLITCEDFDAKSGFYKYRRMVRAVLISVVPEK
ncbi:MAG: sortase [Chloroflexi bacterium]|nr:sortase [Chloroflexota bacterium]